MESELSWTDTLLIWEHVLVLNHVVEELIPLEWVLGACAARRNEKVHFSARLPEVLHEVRN